MNLENIMNLENEIIKEIRKDNTTVVSFQYDRTKSPEVTVRVFTQNPITKEFFLMVSITGPTEEEALEAVLEYAKTHKSTMDSYTVVWAKKDPKGPLTINTSHFYCKNTREVDKKFFEGKDEDLYIIYEIKLNPKG